VLDDNTAKELRWAYAPAACAALACFKSPRRSRDRNRETGRRRFVDVGFALAMRCTAKCEMEDVMNLPCAKVSMLEVALENHPYPKAGAFVI